MVRIAGETIDASVLYREGEHGSYIEMTVPHSRPLTDEEVVMLRDATMIEELSVNYGEVGEPSAAYSLAGWLGIEKAWDGIHFKWQTYRTTDIEQLRQDNEDLTAALLELAAIIGGEE